MQGFVGVANQRQLDPVIVAAVAIKAHFADCKLGQALADVIHDFACLALGIDIIGQQDICRGIAALVEVAIDVANLELCLVLGKVFLNLANRLLKLRQAVIAIELVVQVKLSRLT